VAWGLLFHRAGSHEIVMAPLTAAVAAGELPRHRRGHIGVVMRYFPRSSFSLIDVRHANLGSDLLSAELGLDMLNANFLGDFPSEVDELVFQFNLPF
jgi:hypothetical protein